jgi:hypothetical protein
MSNEKEYLYYILSIGTMPRISVCKLEIRSKIDRTVVCKIGEVIKKIPMDELDKPFRTPSHRGRSEKIEAFTLDRNQVEKLYDEINSYNMEKRIKEIEEIKELLVEFEENKNPNRKIKIYGDK